MWLMSTVTIPSYMCFPQSYQNTWSPCSPLLSSSLPTSPGDLSMTSTGGLVFLTYLLNVSPHPHLPALRVFLTTAPCATSWRRATCPHLDLIRTCLLGWSGTLAVSTQSRKQYYFLSHSSHLNLVSFRKDWTLSKFKQVWKQAAQKYSY